MPIFKRKVPMHEMQHSLRDISMEILQSNIEKYLIEVNSESNIAWKKLKDCGSLLWLDTGDLPEASALWCAEMSGLTTNNTLLNNEIQKGIYDDFIKEAGEKLAGLEEKEMIREIAFLLNAMHGLILSKSFKCRVSVELHTDFAHDQDAIVAYGKRFFEINPEQFVIKVPYTPTGLIGARILSDKGIPVNFTLQFSARQNYISTILARPAFNNVFLGRIGAYLKNNDLGNGKLAGEKTTFAAQTLVRKHAKNNTKLIGASIRSEDQLPRLAGIDVLTIPVQVAQNANEMAKTKLSDNSSTIYETELFENIKNTDVKVEKLWEISKNEEYLIESLKEDPPETAIELINRGEVFNCKDLFPMLTDNELNTISNDGKIPIHSKWIEKVREDEIAIDTLLNLAGLASFTKDQSALDARIKGLISS